MDGFANFFLSHKISIPATICNPALISPFDRSSGTAYYFDCQDGFNASNSAICTIITKTLVYFWRSWELCCLKHIVRDQKCWCLWWYCVCRRGVNSSWLPGEIHRNKAFSGRIVFGHFVLEKLCPNKEYITSTRWIGMGTLTVVLCALLGILIHGEKTRKPKSRETILF